MLYEAVDTALELLGPLELVAPEAASVRMLAQELDLSPGDTDLWREFRFALKALREAAGSDVDSAIADLLGRLGGADVRNSAD